MVGWHHQLNGHESEQTLGDSKGQGSLAYCSPCGRKESDATEWLNNNKQVDSVRVELHCWIHWASQVVLVVKNPPANAGDIRDVGLIPGSGRSLE